MFKRTRWKLIQTLVGSTGFMVNIIFIVWNEEPSPCFNLSLVDGDWLWYNDGNRRLFKPCSWCWSMTWNWISTVH